MQNEEKPKDAPEEIGKAAASGNGVDGGTAAEAAPMEKSAEKRAEQAEKDLLYLKAELENYKRRMLRDQDNAIRFANERIVGELLTVVDLLDRALQSSKPLKVKAEGTTAAGEVANFLTGIDLTFRELLQVLSRFGVELTGTVGEKFDPAKHEAISQQETSPDQADTVLDVMQRGSTLHGRLLKPARVVVGVTKS